MLENALSHAAAQVVPAHIKWEIIVVDNNSLDSTAEVVASAATQHKNIRYVVETNRGLSSARNRGIQEAKGELLCFIDDDVILPSDYVAKVFESRQAGRWVVGGGRVIADRTLPALGWLSKIKPNRLNGPLGIYDRGETDFMLDVDDPRYPIGANMLITASVFEKIGGFDMNLGRMGSWLRSGEDSNFYQRCRAAGFSIAYCGTCPVKHVVPPNRLKRWYFIRWTFVASMNGSNEQLPATARVFLGAPRFAWRRVLKNFLNLTLTLFEGRGMNRVLAFTGSLGELLGFLAGKRPIQKRKRGKIRGGHAIEITTCIGCRNACKFCPQDKLAEAFGARSDSRMLTFENFTRCIDKVPRNVRIIFSGFCEAWSNPECTRMVLYAAKQKRPIAIYTTAVGMTLDDIGRIETLPFKEFVVHLPSAERIEQITIDDEFIAVLRRLRDSKIKVQWHHHGNAPDPEVMTALGFDAENVMQWGTITRAGNLTNSGPVRRAGKIKCKLDHRENILLPNGDVVLCCMDWGMKHVLGNLLEQEYTALFDGQEFTRVIAGMKKESADILCRHCDVKWSTARERFNWWFYDTYKKLPKQLQIVNHIKSLFGARPRM